MSPEVRSGALGVLVVVLGWAGWAALHADDAAESVAVAPAVVDALPAPPPPADRTREVMAASARSRVNASPPHANQPEARLGEGFVLEHGVVTAVRASPDARPAARPDIGQVALPPGVSPADAEVSPGGVVTVNRVTRSTTQADATQAAEPNPFRAPEQTRSR